MDPKQLIEQIAEAGEEFFITWQDYSGTLLEDLKQLAALLPVKNWESGKLVDQIIDNAIKKYGANGEKIPESLQDNFESLEFECLKDWTESTFNDADRLILDVIIYRAMQDTPHKPNSRPQTKINPTSPNPL